MINRTQGWRVKLNVPVESSSSSGASATLLADFVVQRISEPLALLMPLRGTAGQLAYTVKAGGAGVEGALSLVDSEVSARVRRVAVGIYLAAGRYWWHGSTNNAPSLT